MVNTVLPSPAMRRGLVFVSILILSPALPAVAVEVTTAPYEGFAIFSPLDPGYVNVPDHPDLDPTSEITLEAWVNIGSGGGCPTIAGKGYFTNYWLGFCGDKLRSYIGGQVVDSGEGAEYNGIDLPFGQWVHVAMTSDGSHRRHYIDGNLVTQVPEPGTLTPNSAAFRIGRDVNWNVVFDGAIDEVRLWNRALSTEEIRDYSRFALQYEVDGLVAVWDFGPNEYFGNHDGTIVGSLAGLTDPLGSCSNTSSRLCLGDRFTVTVEWQTNTDSGMASAVPPNSNDTGLFWFFDPDNWEVMVKVLNVCGFLNDRVWVFIAASTDQGYTIRVRDSLTGKDVEYNKAVGPPAPAITDTNALDVCNPF